MELLICSICGNQVSYIKNKGPRPFCCGKVMDNIRPNTVDASQEKHVPIVSRDGNKIKVVVGEVEHPMVDVHYIEWILLETNKGKQRRLLSPNDKPEANFILSDDEELIAVYAYCNLHSLWRS